MNIERALTIPGWMTEAELGYIADRASRSKIIVELGSWRGRSAVAWSENTDGVVYCIDTWDINAFGDVRFPGDTDELYTRTEWLLTEFMRHTKGCRNIVPIRTNSKDGAAVIGRLGIRPDTIFIDAGHTEPEICSDLNAWMPLLADGGVLCGHDYAYSGWPDVKRVIDRTIPQFRVIGSIWTTEL